MVVLTRSLCPWHLVLPQYCEASESIIAAMVAIRKTIGDLPLLPGSAAHAGSAEDGDEEAKGSSTPAAKGPRVLADGTYASQSAAADVAAAVEAAKADVSGAARAAHLVVPGIA